MLSPHVFLAEPSHAVTADPVDTFRRDLLAGLQQTPRSIPPKYFYDPVGSALFDRICALPAYYPTRTELQILADKTAKYQLVATAMAEAKTAGLEKIGFQPPRGAGQ